MDVRAAARGHVDEKIVAEGKYRRSTLYRWMFEPCGSGQVDKKVVSSDIRLHISIPIYMEIQLNTSSFVNL